jgi:hypothetical protein
MEHNALSLEAVQGTLAAKGNGDAVGESAPTTLF